MTIAPPVAPVRLDGVLGIRSIEPLRRTLAEAIGSHPAVEIDCSGAESVDLSAIQLLLAARRSGQRAGNSVVLSVPLGPALESALRQGGFLASPGESAPAPDPFWLGAA